MIFVILKIKVMFLINYLCSKLLSLYDFHKAINTQNILMFNAYKKEWDHNHTR